MLLQEELRPVEQTDTAAIVSLQEDSVEAGVPDRDQTTSVAYHQIGSLGLVPLHVGDQLIVCGQHAVFMARFGISHSILALKLPELRTDLFQVSLAPDLACVSLIQEFAHEDDLVGVVSGCFTELVLRVQVNQSAVFQITGQRLAKSTRLAAQWRIKHQLKRIEIATDHSSVQRC